MMAQTLPLSDRAWPIDSDVRHLRSASVADPRRAAHRPPQNLFE